MVVLKADVVIVGGGAAGLVAAIVCARLKKNVIVLEHKDRIGKKILATGNGKCNYTNLEQKLEYYRGNQNAFPKSGLEQFGAKETIAFFGELGIYPKIKNGYLYPNSEQAASILEVLQMEIQHLQCRVYCEEHVTKIESVCGKERESFFYVKTKEHKYQAKQVILATGGKASEKLGSDGSGYALAKALGHSIVMPVPALTALKCKEKYYKDIAGVRTEAKVTLFLNGQPIVEEQGELQLTNYGISGIPVFQISRYAAKGLQEKKEVKVCVDYVPMLSREELYAVLEKRFRTNHYKTLEEAMVGFLNRKLTAMLLKEAKLGSTLYSHKLTKAQLEQLVIQLKACETVVTATNGFENAQVTAGGVATSEVCEKTMESKCIEGVYLVGELLDVDGICGGYNLQWAWTSGYLAGKAAGEKSKKGL